MTFKRHSRSSKMSLFDRAHMISYYLSIATMAPSRIVFHIWPDIGGKSQNSVPRTSVGVIPWEFHKYV